ncbi:MAG: isoprenyl transferase [Lachnospiraceae bacterium]|nr:isoprenyl transferase [Lachnospiraceae bacterium]
MRGGINMVPKHIAIIMDGNGRWAKSKGLPRSAGHVKGAANIETIARAMKKRGIKYLTIYAFSTENWIRPKDEVDKLMELLEEYLTKAYKNAEKNKMRLKVIGRRDNLSEKIQKKIEEAEEATSMYDELVLQVAFNYGSRDEIVRATKAISNDVAEGKLNVDDINEETLSSYLDTSDVPDPDLLIRTSGEERLSNYLLWQLAYSEFYFSEVPWPAFSVKNLDEAIEEFNNRNRRYGNV